MVTALLTLLLAAEPLRLAPNPALEISPGEFRRLGHELVDQLSEVLAAMPAA